MNYLLPENIPKHLRAFLIPCQWGEFIERNKQGSVIGRYKVSSKNFPKIRGLCKLIKREPLRVEPSNYSLDIPKNIL